MPSLVADTHALIWYLLDPEKLSADADAAMQVADTTPEDSIYVSAITLCETIYLVEKGRIPAADWQRVLDIIQDSTTSYQVLAVDFAVAEAMNHIPRNIVPDLPDRIIAATANAHQLPLVTADSRIRAAPITIIW